jgi:hypothetical protein
MFKLFKEKKEPKNLKEILFQFKELEKKLENLSKELKELKKKNISNFQKLGIVRFNPFKEVGGDQSFSIAILDGNDSGIVITSLYTREGNRVFGKPVKEGRSEYLLSDEEKEAINKAKNYEKNKSKSNTKTAGSGGSRPH